MSAPGPCSGLVSGIEVFSCGRGVCVRFIAVGGWGEVFSCGRGVCVRFLVHSIPVNITDSVYAFIQTMYILHHFIPYYDTNIL